MKSTTLRLIVIVVGILILVALFIKGDVKASFKVMGTGFTLETTKR